MSILAQIRRSDNACFARKRPVSLISRIPLLTARHVEARRDIPLLPTHSSISREMSPMRLT
ncbi:MAG TPA: hypothetical protein G4N94_02350 [Caldilineae bacterium]|nr:hypothetical protein [Caldilineae bacterium]